MKETKTWFEVRADDARNKVHAARRRLAAHRRYDARRDALELALRDAEIKAA